MTDSAGPSSTSADTSTVRYVVLQWDDLSQIFCGAPRFETPQVAEREARLLTTQTAKLHEVWRVERVFPKER